MSIIGKTDNFERKYMAKFRSLASNFGEIVTYEYDRGARDIGIHLTHRLRSGKERLSTALCWFQMKGIMTSTLSDDAYKKCHEITIHLKVSHLRYWYLQPVPTYLAVYVECVDDFLVTNIQDIVARTWGRDILTLDQKTASIAISKDSPLDEQAFRLILARSDFEEYRKALGTESNEVRLCVHDYDLIWHIGTAAERHVEHRLVFWDWQSKTRGQLFLQERKADSSDDWLSLREHWQYMMTVSHLHDAYPYLEFKPDEHREDALSWEYEDLEYLVTKYTLPNGSVVTGEDAAGEYILYEMRVVLNEVGMQAFDWVSDLKNMGLIEINTAVPTKL